MNKLLKNSAGFAAILVIIIIVVGAAAGGATVLAVRMVVTGEDYLQPFVDWGWISEDDSDDDEEDGDGETKEFSHIESTSRLSDEVTENKSDTVQYYGSITYAEMEDLSKSDSYYDMYDSIELEISAFAVDDKVVELVFHIDLGKVLKVLYDEYGDELADEGYDYDSYEDFEDEMLPYLESSLESGLESGDDDYKEYFNIYSDDGVIELYVTSGGFDSLYETYDIDPDSENVDDFLDAIEEGLGVKMKEV